MKKLVFILALLLTCNTATVVANNVDNDKIETASIIKHEVFFNTDEHTITSEEFQKLLVFIKETENVSIERMTILGFCDDRGTNIYNQKLSDKRANAIRDIIALYRNSNEKPEIVNTNGKGEVALTTEAKALFNELRTLNRKVTIVIAPKKLIAGSFFGEDLTSGDLINLNTINFKRGLRYPTAESTTALKDLADFLVKRDDIFFTINGHVCCTENGLESRDRETGVKNLSVVRAEFIRDYLVKAGVDANRIRYQGLAGKFNLNGDDSQDRRVELLVRYISK